MNRSLRKRARGFAILLLASLAAHAPTVQAGNGPHNWLVVYDPSDPHGPTIARHYQEARGFPEKNLVPYTFPRRATGSPSINYRMTAAEGWALVGHLRTNMTARGLNGQIHGVTLVGNAPNALQSTSQGTIALNWALTLSPGATNQASWETRFSNYYSEAFRGPSNGTSGTFNPTTEIRSDIGFGYSANQFYWLGTHLGYTGIHGLRPDEVFTLIDRAAGADGTAPEGTVYWPLNFDVRSTTREPQAPYVEKEWKQLGLRYLIYGQSYGGGSYGVPENKTAPPGSYPHTNRAVQGAIAGVWTFNLDDKPSLYTPGAIAEQLTSFGGVMGSTLAWSQTECTAWLRAGAAGTSGTVTEPYATWSKFPHSRIHSHYFNGATLAEAFTQALRQPYQTLVMGEPLCQPYAKVPVVTLSGVTPGQTLSGTVTLGASASSPAGVEPNLDLAVDGRVVRIGQQGESVAATRVAGGFQIDTATLSDGWHELRVIAYTANAVRSQGFATVQVLVNNTGASVGLTAPATAQIGSDFQVTATLANIPDAASVQIRSLGQVLATLGASGGTAAIPADTLSYKGTNRLFAVAITSAGKEVSSAPREIAVTWPPAPALPEEATIPGAIAVARVFTQNVTSAGFDWAAAVPAATIPVKDRFSLTVENWMQWPMISDPTGKTGGIEFITRFYARETGIYDFALEGWAALGMAIDGVDLTGGVVGSLVETSAALEAGWHEVRIRGALPLWSATFKKPIEATFRAPYSRRFHNMGWKVTDFEYFSLDHCAAPVAALDLPRLSGRATGPGEAALSWSGGPTTATSWSIQRHADRPAVSLVQYTGGNTAPTIVGPDDPDAMRPGARTANDGGEKFTLVPPWLQGGLRMITATADHAAPESSLIYRVQVPASTTIYAVINRGNEGLPAWMTTQGDWVKVSTRDSSRAEGLNVESAATANWQVWKKIVRADAAVDLGGPGGPSWSTAVYDAISFVFIKETKPLEVTITAYTGTNTPPAIVGPTDGNGMVAGARTANDGTTTFTQVPALFRGGLRLIAAAADRSAGPSNLIYRVHIPAGTTVFGVVNRDTTVKDNSNRPAWMTAQGGWNGYSDGVVSSATSHWKYWWKTFPTTTALDLGGAGGAAGDATAYDAISFVFVKDEFWQEVATAAGSATGAIVSGLAAGTHTLRVVAVAAPSLAVPSNEIALNVAAAQTNGAPAVDAGPDLQVAGAGVAVALRGMAADDGLPAAPGALTLSWSKVSGPGDVSFGDAASASTTATFNLPGSYVLRLAADDGLAQAADQVGVIVTGGTADNEPPLVNAGPDASITQVESLVLAGSATDDGLPAMPGRLTARWRKVSGPGIVTFHEPSHLAVPVHFSAPGVYQLELSVTDGEKSAADTLRVTVSGSPNNPPTANAGPDREVPAQEAVALTGTAGDDGLPSPPGRLTTLWSQASGPAQATIASPTSLSTTVTFPDVGTYTLDLLVDDGVAFARDSVVFTVVQQSAGNTAPRSGIASAFDFPSPGAYFVNPEVSDDGLPKPPGAVTSTWELLSGPGQATAVADYERANSLLAFDAPGTYQLELTLDDGLLQSIYPVTATVADTHRYGNVFAWGNSPDNLGGPFRDWISITPPAKIGWRWKQVAVGSYSSYALTGDGKVLACGRNNSLELGIEGTTNDRIHFAEVPGLSNVIQIAHSSNGGVALKSDGTVWTWGSNSSGQLGNNTTNNRATPAQVPGLAGVTSISGGLNFVLAVKSDGTVWGWGGNSYGQLGTGSTATAQRTPVQMLGITNAVKTTCAQYASIILLSDGTVRACGWGQNGRLGDGTTIQRNSPVQVLTSTSPVTPLTGITDISAYSSGGHVMAIGTGGQVWVWGSNSFGKLGLPSGTNQSTVAVKVPYADDPTGFLTGVRKVAADSLASFALLESGKLLGWGYGYYHLWGTSSDFSTRYTPGPVINLPPLANVWAGNMTAFGLQKSTGYDTFAAAHFTPEQIAGGQAGPSHDFLGMGRPNLFAYAFGGDPTNPSWSPPLSWRIENGQLVYEAEYLVAPDLDVAFETSTDLLRWTPAVPDEAAFDAAGDIERAALRFNLRPDKPRLFVRTKVLRKDP